MFLIRLVYASTISNEFHSTDIDKILESARKNNGKNNITGMLCFNRKFFLQYLEGSREQVNETYHHILNDPRHKKIIILDYKEIALRDFPNWSMSYVPESSLTDPVNLKYSGSSNFTPYDMSGESAQKMMLELSETMSKTI